MLSFEKSALPHVQRWIRLKTIQYYLIAIVGYADDCECEVMRMIANVTRLAK